MRGLAAAVRDRALYCIDLDAHQPGQQPHAALKRAAEQLPRRITSQLAVARSTGGRGRLLPFWGPPGFASGLLFAGEQHSGEFLGRDRQLVDVDEDRWIRGNHDTLPAFDEADTELLLAAFGYRPTQSSRKTPAAEPEFDNAYTRYCVDHLESFAPGGIFHCASARTRALLAEPDNAGDPSRERYSIIANMWRCGYVNEEIRAFAYVVLRNHPWAGKDNRTPAELDADTVGILGKLAMSTPRRIAAASAARKARFLTPAPEPRHTEQRSQRQAGRPTSTANPLEQLLAHTAEAAGWTRERQAAALDVTDRQVRRYAAMLTNSISMTPAAGGMHNDAPLPPGQAALEPATPADSHSAADRETTRNDAIRTKRHIVTACDSSPCLNIETSEPARLNGENGAPAVVDQGADINSSAAADTLSTVSVNPPVFMGVETVETPPAEVFFEPPEKLPQSSQNEPAENEQNRPVARLEGADINYPPMTGVRVIGPNVRPVRPAENDPVTVNVSIVQHPGGTWGYQPAGKPAIYGFDSATTARLAYLGRRWGWTARQQLRLTVQPAAALPVDQAYATAHAERATVKKAVDVLPVDVYAGAIDEYG